MAIGYTRAEGMGRRRVLCLEDDADFFDVDDDAVFPNVDVGANPCPIYGLVRYGVNSFVFVPMWRGGRILAGTVQNAEEPALVTADGEPLIVQLDDEGAALRSSGVRLHIDKNWITILFPHHTLNNRDA